MIDIFWEISFLQKVSGWVLQSFWSNQSYRLKEVSWGDIWQTPHTHTHKHTPGCFLAEVGAPGADAVLIICLSWCGKVSVSFQKSLWDILWWHPAEMEAVYNEAWWYTINKNTVFTHRSCVNPECVFNMLTMLNLWSLLCMFLIFNNQT